MTHSALQCSDTQNILWYTVQYSYTQCREVTPGAIQCHTVAPLLVPDTPLPPPTLPSEPAGARPTGETEGLLKYSHIFDLQEVHCTALYCTELHCLTHLTALNYTALQYTPLHYNAPSSIDGVTGDVTGPVAAAPRVLPPVPAIAEQEPVPAGAETSPGEYRKS